MMIIQSYFGFAPHPIFREDQGNSLAMMSQNIIELKDIHKSFNGQLVLHQMNLNIKQNEFLTILGPSGCGKTTTLRIIAGFEEATGGTLLFDGEDIAKLPPHKRNVNTVFQSYALFPHMNVADNVAFGLKIKKQSKQVMKEKVKTMLALVNLSEFENRSVKSLSGGQQQRVAIARALINEPKVLLLDEPLGALDLKLRKEMQTELKNMQRKLGITFIYVTHDQEEALTMSDTVVVMNQGHVLQQGTPEDIYNEPMTSFVANFIGTSNIVDGHMNEDYTVTFQNTAFKCVDKKPSDTTSLVDVVIRPEDIEINPHSNGAFVGKVIDITFFGVHYEMKVMHEGYLWKIHSTAMYPVGTQVSLDIPPNAIHIMKKGENHEV